MATLLHKELEHLRISVSLEVSRMNLKWRISDHCDLAHVFPLPDHQLGRNNDFVGATHFSPLP